MSWLLCYVLTQTLYNVLDRERLAMVYTKTNCIFADVLNLTLQLVSLGLSIKAHCGDYGGPVRCLPQITPIATLPSFHPKQLNIV